MKVKINRPVYGIPISYFTIAQHLYNYSIMDARDYAGDDFLKNYYVGLSKDKYNTIDGGGRILYCRVFIRRNEN